MNQCQFSSMFVAKGGIIIATKMVEILLECTGYPRKKACQGEANHLTNRRFLRLHLVLADIEEYKSFLSEMPGHLQQENFKNSAPLYRTLSCKDISVLVD